MPKRKKKQPKDSNIASSSLLPARCAGEKPDMVFNIKKEPLESNESEPMNITDNEKVNDLYKLISEAKRHVTRSDDNLSNTSVCTELMETDKGPHNDLDSYNSTENKLVPSSVSYLHLKQGSEIINNQAEVFTQPLDNITPVVQSNVAEITCDNVENFSQNLFTPQVKEEPTVNDESYRCDQDVSNTTNNIKAEPLESDVNVPDLQHNENNESLNHKRKPDTFEEAFAIIRKKIKKEKVEDNLSEVEEDNEITVLPVPKIEKNVDVITISDEDEPNMEAESVAMRSSEIENLSISHSTNNNLEVPIELAVESLTPLPASVSICPKEPVQQNFSTEILNYFNVVSEIDRYDCHKGLEYLLNKRSNNHLRYLFPIGKTECTLNREIQKGDILFKKTVTKTNCDVKKASISPDVECNVSEEEVQCLSDSLSQCFSPPVPSISPSAKFLPKLPSLSNGEVNPSLNSCTSSSITVSPDLQELLSNPELAKMLANIAEENLINPRNVVNGSNHSDNFLFSPAIAQIQNHTSLRPLNSAATSFAENAPSSSALRRDPRLAVNRRVTAIEKRNPLQVKCRPPVLPKDSLQSVASLPNNNFQAFPGPSASSHPARFSATLSPLSFLPRTTIETLSKLYSNVGKEFTTEYFNTLILLWNPSWIINHKNTSAIPPICELYKPVQIIYSNKQEYYITYMALHLLHVWFNIYQRWEETDFTVISCKVDSVGNSDKHHKICCSAELGDKEVWPKGDDIAWCTHNRKVAFLLVDDVKKKPLGTRIKLKITLESLYDFNLKTNDEISLRILWNIRSASLQAKALHSLEKSMIAVACMPQEVANSIHVVELDKNKKIKEQRDDILEVASKKEARVVVIDIYQAPNLWYNTVLLLTQLCFNILFNEKYSNQITANGRGKVLIILKNDLPLEKLYKSLSQYNPILAVRTKQINLSPEMLECTMEHRLERKVNINAILRDHNIFLTTFTAFTSAEKDHLSKINGLTCIINDAHLCTEPETAVPLTLSLRKLLLIGIRLHSLDLPEFLEEYHFDVTLFTRLLKIKNKI